MFGFEAQAKQLASQVTARRDIHASQAQTTVVAQTVDGKTFSRTVTGIPETLELDFLDAPWIERPWSLSDEVISIGAGNYGEAHIWIAVQWLDLTTYQQHELWQILVPASVVDFELPTWPPVLDLVDPFFEREGTLVANIGACDGKLGGADCTQMASDQDYELVERYLTRVQGMEGMGASRPASASLRAPPASLCDPASLRPPPAILPCGAADRLTDMLKLSAPIAGVGTGRAGVVRKNAR